MLKFQDPSYLKKGTEKQKKAYRLLTQTRTLEILGKFTPVLTGSLPLDIDTQNSIRINCCWENKAEFFKTLNQFQEEENFEIRDIDLRGIDTIYCCFDLGEFKVRLMGQNFPVEQQESYLHLLKEALILEKKGEDFKQEIIELKKIGLETEPAFAYLLNLNGDPYLQVLEYRL
ncbi:DUF4269 domain-containing protein [Salegentibacter sp. HM20]